MRIIIMVILAMVIMSGCQSGPDVYRITYTDGTVEDVTADYWWIDDGMQEFRLELSTVLQVPVSRIARVEKIEAARSKK